MTPIGSWHGSVIAESFYRSGFAGPNTFATYYLLGLLSEVSSVRSREGDRWGTEGRSTIDSAIRGMGDVMAQHENLQELLTRLNNIRDSMEEALGDVKGIEDDYRRGLLEAHIRGAIREINAQITELVSSHRKMAED